MQDFDSCAEEEIDQQAGLEVLNVAIKSTSCSNNKATSAMSEATGSEAMAMKEALQEAAHFGRLERFDDALRAATKAASLDRSNATVSPPRIPAPCILARYARSIIYSAILTCH